MTRKHIGYIMLAAELIFLAVQVIVGLLFDWGIFDWAEQWTLFILVPVAAALIVSFGPRVWNIYPLIFTAADCAYWAVYNSAFDQLHTTPEYKAWAAVTGYNSQLYDALTSTPEKIHYERIKAFEPNLRIIQIALAVAALGVWLILHIVKKAKQEHAALLETTSNNPNPCKEDTQ